MGLLQVANHKVVSGSEVSSVSLTNCITDNNVYILIANNLNVAGNGGICDIRPLVDSTQDTTANFDIAWLDINSTATFQFFNNSNQDMIRATDGMAITPNTCNFVAYLHNWYSSSLYSKIILDVTSHNNTRLRGYQEGGVKKETTSFNGIYIETNQATSPAGFNAGSQFTMYKVV
tara:strand:+ start:87 stop:611 length:525 start_codon:yes stop_codon:yes gene_type:complete